MAEGNYDRSDEDVEFIEYLKESWKEQRPKLKIINTMLTRRGEPFSELQFVFDLIESNIEGIMKKEKDVLIEDMKEQLSLLCKYEVQKVATEIFTDIVENNVFNPSKKTFSFMNDVGDISVIFRGKSYKAQFKEETKMFSFYIMIPYVYFQVAKLIDSSIDIVSKEFILSIKDRIRLVAQKEGTNLIIYVDEVVIPEDE